MSGRRGGRPAVPRGPEGVDSSTDRLPGPVRTCVGCRRRSAKNELLRVVAEDQGHGLVLVPERTMHTALDLIELLHGGPLGLPETVALAFRRQVLGAVGVERLDPPVLGTGRGAAEVEPPAAVGPAEQQHRFDRRRGTQADRALTFTDGVASAFTGDKEVLDALQAAKSRAVTTVGRVVADPDLRGAFGFDLVGGELLFLHDRAAMRQALLRLLRDLANNPVGTFMGKGDRRDYYQKIASADLPDKDSRLPQAMPAAELPTDPTELDGHEAPAADGSTTTDQTCWFSRSPDTPSPARSAGRT